MQFAGKTLLFICKYNVTSLFFTGKRARVRLSAYGFREPIRKKEFFCFEILLFPCFGRQNVQMNFRATTIRFAFGSEIGPRSCDKNHRRYAASVNLRLLVSEISGIIVVGKDAGKQIVRGYYTENLCRPKDIGFEYTR